MANIAWLVILMTSINLALVLGGVMDVTASKQEGGIISSFFIVNSSLNVKDMNTDFTSEAQNVTSKGVVAGTAFEGFTDTPSAVSSLVGFLFDVSTAPFQLLMNPSLELPVQFRLLIGFPLSLMWIFAIVSFFRKGT